MHGAKRNVSRFWSKTLKVRHSCRWEQNLEVDLVAEDGRVLSRFMWIRVGASD